MDITEPKVKQTTNFASIGFDIGLSAIVILISWSSQFFVQGDAVYYESAQLISEFFDGENSLEDLTFRPPLYPVFLAIAGEIIGGLEDRISVFYTLNTILLAFSFFLVLRLVRYVGDLTQTYHWALLGSLLIFLLHLKSFREPYALRETELYTILLCLSIFLFAHFRKSALGIILLGMVCGALFLTRPTGFVAPLAISMSLLLSARRWEIARCFRMVCLLVIAFTATVSVWMLPLNMISASPQFAPSCTSGLNLFKGNHGSFRDLYLYVDVDRGTVNVARAESESLCDYDARLREIALNDIQSRTFPNILSEASKKFFLFFSGALPIGNGIVVFESGENVIVDLEISEIHILYGSVIFLISMTSIGAGIFFVCRVDDERRGVVMATLLVILGHAGTYAMSWPEARFKIPLDPLIVFCLITAIFGTGRRDSAAPLYTIGHSLRTTIGHLPRSVIGRLGWHGRSGGDHGTHATEPNSRKSR